MLTRRIYAALAKDGDVLERNSWKKIKKHTIQKQKYIGYQNTIDTTGVTNLNLRSR
jgi:hypothetical protein